MIFELVEQEESLLKATIHDIEYKQALPPHDDKVLFKPGYEWIKSSMSVEDLHVETSSTDCYEDTKIKKSKAKKKALESIPIKSENKKLRVDAKDSIYMILLTLKRAGDPQTIKEITDVVLRHPRTIRLAVKRGICNNLIIRKGLRKSKGFGRPASSFSISDIGLEFLRENFKELSS